MQQSNPPASPVSGNVLFYTSPEPVNVEQHANLGLNPSPTPFKFVAQSNLIPLTVSEFASCALSYPIIFLGEQKMPLAVMGLSSNDNLFVEADGTFRADAYVPAFVRRYPFVFANDEQAERMILCIDRGSDQVVDGGEVRLFEDGKPTPYLEQCLKFCQDFETERQRTDNFVKLLTDLDLFDTRDAVFTPRNPDGSPGEPQKIADYFAVSEEKLRKLSPEKMVELRDNGALHQIYAHLISLYGWDRLVAIAMIRAQAMPTAANA